MAAAGGEYSTSLAVLGRPLLSEVRRAQARWRWRCLVPPRSTPLHAVSKHEYEEVCVNVYETGRHSAAGQRRALTHANVYVGRFSARVRGVRDVNE